MWAKTTSRVLSLDVFRGVVMIFLVSAGFGAARVARHLTEAGIPSHFWDTLGGFFSHVTWVGCSSWDLIQPFFIFMVGMAMPYSYHNRQAIGQSRLRIFSHAIYRALVLIFLGILLTLDLWRRDPNFSWSLGNVLTQIGLGYVFVMLLIDRGIRAQLAAAASILFLYWILFALWPPAGSNYNFAAVGIDSEWTFQSGFFTHWEKNANPAHYFDVWFLNLFPRMDPFLFHKGGYQTLNFVPSMVTMISGLIVGELLKKPIPAATRLRFLLIMGSSCIIFGWLLSATFVPMIKRIWTPSWTLFSAGCACWFMALMFYVIEIRKYRWWTYPFVIVGRNSIAIYVLYGLCQDPIKKVLTILLPVQISDNPYSPIIMSATVLFILWGIAYWMTLKKIYLKI